MSATPKAWFLVGFSNPTGRPFDLNDCPLHMEESAAVIIRLERTSEDLITAEVLKNRSGPISDKPAVVDEEDLKAILGPDSDAFLRRFP